MGLGKAAGPARPGWDARQAQRHPGRAPGVQGTRVVWIDSDASRPSRDRISRWPSIAILPLGRLRRTDGHLGASGHSRFGSGL